MIQLRTFLLGSLLLAACQPGARAERSLMQKDNADWYGESIDQTLEEYRALGSVPNSRIQWLASTYDRTALQVTADLKRQSKPVIFDADPGKVSTKSPPTHIPDASWNREVYLTPEYERRLETVIAKYNGVAFVPEASVVWLAGQWNTTPVQVKFDLQRVQRHDPDKFALEGFAH